MSFSSHSRIFIVVRTTMVFRAGKRARSERNYGQSRRTAIRRRTTPWYEKKYNAMQLAHKAYKGVWYLKGLVNSEMFHIINSASPTVSNTGSISSLTNIGQGDVISNRTGNSVLVRNLLIRLSLEQHASATFTFYRVMLVVDTQQIGDTSPTIADILESSSTLSSLNTNEPGRFVVLKNWFLSTDTGRGLTQYLEWYSDNLMLHVKYNGTASSDIQRNGIYLVLLSDQATNTPTCFYNVKIGYHDN